MPLLFGVTSTRWIANKVTKIAIKLPQMIFFFMIHKDTSTLHWRLSDFKRLKFINYWQLKNALLTLNHPKFIMKTPIVDSIVGSAISIDISDLKSEKLKRLEAKYLGDNKNKKTRSKLSQNPPNNTVAGTWAIGHR